jgi:hypothetical protein
VIQASLARALIDTSSRSATDILQKTLQFATNLESIQNVQIALQPRSFILHLSPSTKIHFYAKKGILEVGQWVSFLQKHPATFTNTSSHHPTPT